MPEIESLVSWLHETGETAGNANRLGLGSVYSDLRSLQRTWETLRDRPEIALPRDNRQLVELATHPESLNRLSGERWDKHANTIAGGAIARNVRAHQIALARHYDKSFGTFSFNPLNENGRTRLGLNSRRLPLPQPMLSPFGIKIRKMVIPGHMAPQSTDPVITELAPGAGSFSFCVAGRHYRYSRLGLERAPTDAPPTCE